MTGERERDRERLCLHTDLPDLGVTVVEELD